jgi:hypothetical protein
VSQRRLGTASANAPVSLKTVNGASGASRHAARSRFALSSKKKSVRLSEEIPVGRRRLPAPGGLQFRMGQTGGEPPRTLRRIPHRLIDDGGTARRRDDEEERALVAAQDGIGGQSTAFEDNPHLRKFESVRRRPFAGRARFFEAHERGAIASNGNQSSTRESQRHPLGGKRDVVVDLGTRAEGILVRKTFGDVDVAVGG